tara:strand:- start:2337 stop:3590 length:1254 start_codon:yes stop_codon:yes gene_type:complete
MIENFKISLKEIDKINLINQDDKNYRIKNLEFFNQKGFPTKKDEDWKFSDLREIFSQNFKKIDINDTQPEENKFRLIKDFDHNYILLINGRLIRSDFKFEDKNKIKITGYKEENFSREKSNNPLICLNNALSNEGYNLLIEKDYKFEKVLIIYNLFSEDLSEKILNNKNKITVNKNSELHTIEYTINRSKNKFFNNTYENIILNENAKFKNISIQAGRSEGYFHKFLNGSIKSDSTYSSFIFSSGLKFNKQDIKINLEGKNSNCEIKSALFLNKEDHQEIKTLVNHLVPNCKSFQKIKSVLDSNAKGVYQGKIFVKDIAQKTNAYQLSKALLISENSEFDSKPELEIYADDVKCSHGSTSGNVDENSIHYLMTRGLTKKEAMQLLINGFLQEIISEIKSDTIKKFVENKLEFQVYGY